MAVSFSRFPSPASCSSSLRVRFQRALPSMRHSALILSRVPLPPRPPRAELSEQKPRPAAQTAPVIGGGRACGGERGPRGPPWRGAQRAPLGAGGGARSRVECVAAVALLPARHAPGAVPEGKCEEGSWRRAGELEGPCGRARCRCGWLDRPRCRFRAEEERAGSGRRAAPGVNSGWQGDTTSGFAALVHGVSSRQKTFALLHTPLSRDVGKPQGLQRFCILSKI